MSGKRILKGIVSIILTTLIALTLPVQVFAQNISQIEEEIVAGNPQEAKPYQVGKIIDEVTTKREEYQDGKTQCTPSKKITPLIIAM